MNDLKPYQTDHLFLLVGTNPLPNYVTARLLAKTDTHIYLVHSVETALVADRLIAALGLTSENGIRIQVDDVEASDIFNKVKEYAQDKQSIGLNYTGGTKAMAVHSYRAVQSVSQDAIFSYLEANTLNMRIDSPRVSSRPFYVGLAIHPTLKGLLGLHGYTLKHHPIVVPFQVDVCRGLASCNCVELRKWCDDNLQPVKKLKKRKKKKYLKETTVFLPTESWFSPVTRYLAGHKTINDLASAWGIESAKVVGWLDGKWLEDYTLWVLQQLAEDCHIHSYGINVEPNERDFEFDVAAMRGYQLFAVSCTTSTKKSRVKSKLFEAYIRARQMGGDEARVGLVCCVPPDNPQNNPSLVQSEVEEEWDAAGKLRVFGAEHLPNLEDHLRDWFNTQP